MLGSIERSLIDSWNACQGADAVIYAPNVPAGSHIADKLGVPCFAACVFPIARTRAFPMLLTPAQPYLGGAYNKLTYTVIEQIGWHALHGTINHWRQETLNMPAVSFRGSSLHPFSDPYGEQPGRQLPWLYGLRAGIPTITIPFFGEQLFWGDRAAELGVGPAPIRRKQLTVERLVDALLAATGDTGTHTCS